MKMNNNRATKAPGGIRVPQQRTSSFRVATRFSLRAMLIVVALLSAVLGWKINQVRNQRIVVDRLTNNSCQVSYDHESPLLGGPRFWEWLKKQPNSIEPPGPQWARSLFGDDFFLVATGVVARNNLTDQLASELAQLPALREVVLRTGDVPPFVAPNVGKLIRLKNLEAISIESDTFEESDLADLSRFRLLNSLSLVGTPRADLLDRDAWNISKLTRLQYLGLYRIDMHEGAFKSLSTSASITYLTLAETPIHETEIASIGGFTGLRTVHFANCGLSHDELVRIRASLPAARVVGN